MYELTGSAWYLGLVGLAQFLPLFLLTLVVGQVADRYDRRMIAWLCQVVQGLAACALAMASFGDWQSKESLLAIVLAAGVARAFEMPTMQALLPWLVPAPFIPRAVTGSASAFQTASIVGPALGGLLYAVGSGTVYLTSGSCFARRAYSFIGSTSSGPHPNANRSLSGRFSLTSTTSAADRRFSAPSRSISLPCSSAGPPPCSRAGACRFPG